MSIGILILALVGILFLFGFRIRKCAEDNDTLINKKIDEEEKKNNN